MVTLLIKRIDRVLFTRIRTIRKNTFDFIIS